MTRDKYTYTYVTLIGKISISEDGEGNICGLYLPTCNLPVAEDRETDVICEAMSQLRDYFIGRRRCFDLPLSCDGTDFQHSVWSEISKIPFGETVTYGELAERIGNPNSSRAVGTACGKNPIPIIVPCHRVVPSAGGIGSYGGGSALKKRLLDLEAEFFE
ncbi:MAG: methylated-DNA--[protein]-cysteine S-methyltransferase [Bacilli bacterium]|jgi:methylated-DNA-[protein]-cysteine S-methyltransferase